MAEWNKNKVEPDNLHNGNEFQKGDNLAVDELNAIVNNSFYASEKATRAEELAESAVRGQGTPITLGGEIISEWSADFVEGEKSRVAIEGAIVHNNNPDLVFARDEKQRVVEEGEILHKNNVDNELNALSENPVQNKVITDEFEKYIKNNKLELVNLFAADVGVNWEYSLSRPITDFTFICIRVKWSGMGGNFLTIPTTACLNYNTNDARMVASTDAAYFGFYFPSTTTWYSANSYGNGAFVQIYGIL